MRKGACQKRILPREYRLIYQTDARQDPPHESGLTVERYREFLAFREQTIALYRHSLRDTTIDGAIQNGWLPELIKWGETIKGAGDVDGGEGGNRHTKHEVGQVVISFVDIATQQQPHTDELVFAERSYQRFRRQMRDAARAVQLATGSAVHLIDEPIARTAEVAKLTRDVPLSGILKKAIDAAEKRNVRLSITLPKIISADVRVVPDDAITLIKQQLINIRDHAAGKRVDIDVREDDEWVTVTIRDDGRGIDEVAFPDANRIFQRDATTRKSVRTVNAEKLGERVAEITRELSSADMGATDDVDIAMAAVEQANRELEEAVPGTGGWGLRDIERRGYRARAEHHGGLPSRFDGITNGALVAFSFPRAPQKTPIDEAATTHES